MRERKILMIDAPEYASKGDWLKLDELRIEQPITCLCCQNRIIVMNIICKVDGNVKEVLNFEKFHSNYRTSLTNICKQFVLDEQNLQTKS